MSIHLIFLFCFLVGFFLFRDVIYYRFAHFFQSYTLVLRLSQNDKLQIVLSVYHCYSEVFFRLCLSHI